MWVKNQDGDLYNLDHADGVSYVPWENKTFVDFPNARMILCEGNAVPIVVDGIIKNRTFVGVN